MPSINEEIVDTVLQRQKFNNPFWETMTHFMYQKGMDQRGGFGSQMDADMEEMEERKA